MSNQLITDLLVDLKFLQGRLIEMNARKNSAVPQEVKDILESINAEFDPQIETANERINAVTARIKSAVLEEAETSKTDDLQAVYSSGRVTWDAKSLDVYAMAHPEIMQFRKEGKPSVSIRKVSKKS